MTIEEIKTNKEILRKLKKAKKIFIKDCLKCMCYALDRAQFRINLCNEVYGKPVCYELLEYNRSFLNSTTETKEGAYWWPREDREARIKAFDKLIKLYKKKSSWLNLFRKSSVSEDQTLQ